jgi:hypothetical protein
VSQTKSAEDIQRTLAAERMDLAELEATYHQRRIEALQYSDARTVKQQEWDGDYVVLSFHRDLLRQRAKVRSLEDELRVALHGTG